MNEVVDSMLSVHTTITSCWEFAQAKLINTVCYQTAERTVRAACGFPDAQ